MISTPQEERIQPLAENVLDLAPTEFPTLIEIFEWRVENAVSLPFGTVVVYKDPRNHKRGLLLGSQVLTGPVYANVSNFCSLGLVLKRQSNLFHFLDPHGRLWGPFSWVWPLRAFLQGYETEVYILARDTNPKGEFLRLLDPKRYRQKIFRWVNHKASDPERGDLLLVQESEDQPPRFFSLSHWEYASVDLNIRDIYAVRHILELGPQNDQELFGPRPFITSIKVIYKSTEAVQAPLAYPTPLGAKPKKRSPRRASKGE